MGVLQGPGSVTPEDAKEHALNEYEKFRIRQDRMFVSDFDDLLATDSLFADVRNAKKDNE